MIPRESDTATVARECVRSVSVCLFIMAWRGKSPERVGDTFFRRLRQCPWSAMLTAMLGRDL